MLPHSTERSHRVCMATAANGWRHLLACDVFVYHAGGTSFGYESEQLKVKAQQIIDDRFISQHSLLV